MYNKTVIRFAVCDIQNNQGVGKSYQLQLRLITLTSTLVIVDIPKTSSKICFKFVTFIVGQFIAFMAKILLRLRLFTFSFTSFMVNVY